MGKPIALAGERREPVSEHGALQEERPEREASNMPSVAARPWSSCAPTTEEDFRGQHAIAAEQNRVAEIGDRLYEADEERIGKAGSHQRQGRRRTPASDWRAASAPLPHAGRHAFDDADQHEKGDRGEGEHLRDQYPRP